VAHDRLIVNERLKATLGWRPRFPTFREGFRDAKTYGSDEISLI
jgi:nucleoside-diphosphate-sugar epimerase